MAHFEVPDAGLDPASFPEKSLLQVPGLREGQRPLTWVLVALTANTTPTGRYSLLFPKTQSSQVYLCSPTGTVSVPRALQAQVKMHNDSSRPSPIGPRQKVEEERYTANGCTMGCMVGAGWVSPPPVCRPSWHPVHWALVKCGNYSSMSQDEGKSCSHPAFQE